MKKILLLLSGMFVFLSDGFASCDLAEMAMKHNHPDKALREYVVCGALRGDISSLFQAANMYYKGEGTVVDYSKAMTYFNKAANLGHAPSQLKLALLYAKGEGAEKDYRRAYTWAYLASEGPDKRWYYPINMADAAKQKVERGADPMANDVLQGIRKSLEDDKRKNTIIAGAMSDLNGWKNRRLHDFARKVMSEEEYEIFRQKLRGAASDPKKVKLLMDNLRVKAIHSGIIKDGE